MKNQLGVIFFFLFFLLSIATIGQNIFSEKSIDYRKSLLPYDVAYTFPLPDKEFVMLIEEKRYEMKLGRYDQYFFEKWEKIIEFNKDENAPQLFHKGDSIVTYCFTINKDQDQIQLTFRYFNLDTGEELTGTTYNVQMVPDENLVPQISFSDDRSKFVVYNYLIDEGSTNTAEFKIFEVGNEQPIKSYNLSPDKISPLKFRAVHLANNADLFLAAIEPDEFKTETYFWSANGAELSQVDNNFFFERPVQRIGEIQIVRQSPSSYFISFTALIEDDLIGFNVTGINVVLKTVLFEYNKNFREQDIESVYNNYYVTSENQREKRLEIPEILKEYRLVASFVNENKDIILAIENLEIPVYYHKSCISEQMSWKHKTNEDKFYFGGDLLLYCFSENGELKWEHTIQKTQFSQANALGLSFIPRMKGNTLELLLYESSKGGNFYIMDLNTVDGSLIKTINLLPDKKFEFAKRNSCWLSDNAVVIFGIAPANLNNRTLMLVEF